MVRLVYGMDEYARQYYLLQRINDTNDNLLYLRIDDLNFALGITAQNLNSETLKNIKRGIKINYSHITNLRLSSGTINKTSLNKDQAKTILESWSSFLSKNYSKLSTAELIRRNMKKKINFVNVTLKNYPEKPGFLPPVKIPTGVEPEVKSAIEQVSTAFSKGNKKGYDRVSDYRSRENSNPYLKPVAAAINVIFFRRTSKLGLDFAFSDSSRNVISGVDFLMYNTDASNQKTQSFDDALYNHKPWHDIENSQTPYVYGPITFSEIRHAKRKGYAVNYIHQ